MVNESRILVEIEGNMDALQGRVHYRGCVQHTSATSQLVMYHSDWKRLKTAVAWILKIKNALLDVNEKMKTNFCSVGKRFVN